MIRFYLVIIALMVVLFSNEYNDDDLDGVPNSLDRCPKTPFSDIVDEYGCSVEKLLRPRSFEYYFEYLYGRDGHFYENSYLTSITLYRKRFDLSITGLYYTNNRKHGFSDLNIKFEYLFNPTPMWDLLVGAGIDLPIYNVSGNKTDYGFSLTSYYYLWDYRVLSGVYYTYTEDRYRKRTLKNSYGGYIGVERFFNGFSLELSYLYHRGKFNSINHLLYTKIEKRFKGGTYLFGTVSKGLNGDTIEEIFSLGVGRRF
ncbi:MAG: hypothetical protein GXO19_04180 [Epsilonproteobacteria bacterium]|nr:hypothetical protein [Campylobacterota bacterium]NPA56920.1 hypothetical protein [Campylobacterota bacterium]